MSTSLWSSIRDWWRPSVWAPSQSGAAVVEKTFIGHTSRGHSRKVLAILRADGSADLELQGLFADSDTGLSWDAWQRMGDGWTYLAPGPDISERADTVLAQWGIPRTGWPAGWPKARQQHEEATP